ncbi:hypothetical protein AU190_12625 [Mycolicibacterium acapulense]|uniref:DUF2786 domain-containing protein n=1 Tax=Mycobacterium lehmannii TaxID=2048550 RepID=A0A101A9M3_9MYCO|nr:DUF2786 domain-containing protein [Mycobacterium lehmannii]KUI05287.1 hypothetical protein AU189_02585 [Mycolicibacterium acapulense]KUI06237.1 hypothetical protein AU190_12625 [Mycolicibacterium acapulense]KUI13372.1 hypothetical protein AU191_16615 [Mycolicibacterium acapulense]KUI18833.1 hypothetical protein AU192_23900 [Mycobacterium lehmannii]
MGRRNREKRAAKHRNRRRSAPKQERVEAFDPAADRAVLLEHLVVALSTAASGPADHLPYRATELLREFRDFAHELDVAADLAMNEAISAAWTHGWQPSDLHEIACRRMKPAEIRYLDEAIVGECRRYAAATLHPDWRADIARLSASVGSRAQPPQMWRWAASNAVDQRDGLVVVLKLLNLLGRLPALEVILPLPGTYRHTATTVTDADEKVLGRVRALLAKAEVTEFPDEAEALSAKAQDLMSRYSLNEAVARHNRGREPAAAARRIWIENPYAAAKATLVQVVSRSNRCRAVWAEGIGFVTVIGCETDLKLVELLTTSLLVQANRAMLRAGRAGTAQARSRTFRQSFLVAYAQRIGERLDNASASVTAEVERDVRLLPVLAANSRAAEDLAHRLFPSTVPRAVSASNGAGWGAGRAAANMAVLDTRDSIAG